MRGDGGGLWDLDRRASSWRKGMGEKRGVLGIDRGDVPNVTVGPTKRSLSFSVNGGKASIVDVTSKDFSTARRYFPTDLYCCVG
jgi:hypothetical protein